MNITIEKTTAPRPKPASGDTIPFGTIFSDHMFLMDFDGEHGWHDARIVPFAPLSISPAASVLHYGMGIFEGLKAYRTPEGSIQLFRPTENIHRMNNSAERMCMPQLPPDEFMLEAIKTLITLDADWAPTAKDASLYVRPFLISVDEDFRLHCNKFLFCILTSPVGAYYSGPATAASIIIEERDVRAIRGGTGYAKCGGNYAGAMRASAEAQRKGYSDVLWLDGIERRYVEEVGSMNIMFLFDDEVATPMLTGSVLPGITRKSCLQLMNEWGMKVSERPIGVAEIMDALKSGRLVESWGCGTAAVISSIGKFAYGGTEYVVGDGKPGKFAQRLYAELTGIQWGRIPDTRGWTFKIC